MRMFSIIGAGLIGAAMFYCPVAAQAKTAKECRAEWQAHKADNQAKKITEKAYVKDCTAAAATEPAKSTEKKTATTPATTKKEESKTKSTSASTTTAKSKSDAKGENQYTTEAQAKARCGTGTVVWANLSSKIFHFSGHADYGHTKNGAYMCERDATSQGMRSAKNEKHP